MKIILIHDAMSKKIIKTYMVNDDCSIPNDMEEQLQESGYSCSIFNPVYLKSTKELMEEVETYFD